MGTAKPMPATLVVGVRCFGRRLVTPQEPGTPERRGPKPKRTADRAMRHPALPFAQFSAIVAFVALFGFGGPALTLVAASEKPGEKFEELVTPVISDPGSEGAAKAFDGIVQLWREQPYQALYVIDSYLEGSLKIVEGEAPDEGKVMTMHQKALVGARAADKAFDTVIFADYASSFVGWTKPQQSQFRAGQRAFKDARVALKANDYAKALEHARGCIDAAKPLGDWWGTAMGYAVMGSAQKELGDFESALTSLSMARLINQQLRLAGAEMNCLVQMLTLSRKIGRLSRARAVCDRGATLAKRMGNQEREVWFLEKGADVAFELGLLREAEELKATAKARQARGS